ncbi:MAG: hypothetical protein LBV80_06605 [Deltaproteobacteria bacterium]|jgi:hypothetical protein|nr:hypothetical protein [Deltaproteobacteria bacterium]
MTSQQNLVTVRGYIISLPKQAGRDDAKVAVQDESGVEYLVLPRGMGLDLADNVNAKVEVAGIVQDKDDQRFILVRQYQLMDEYDDQWYDDKD